MGFELIAASDWAQTILMILKVALGLGFVIFVHELGHFLVAKMCGVKCEKFYIGFDIPMPFGLPSRLYRVQWGETEYGIGILPLGGYVKMLGQDDNPLNAEEEAARTRLPAADGAGSSASSTPTVAAASAAATTPPAPQSGPASPAPASATSAPGNYVLDPRSYTAKAVWQRMLIISAGVIMNLIFAVIFAAFAYRGGVPYTPCEVGQVVPGGPAWIAGIEPDTRIVQIGREGTKRDTLRFDFDLRQSVFAHGDSELALLLRTTSGREEWKVVRPYTVREGWESRSNIGVSPAHTLTLNAQPPVEKESAAAAASPALQGGDKVVAVDGQSLTKHVELQAYLARYPDRSVTLTVERQPQEGESSAEPSTLDVVLPPEQLRHVGLVMEYGPITAVRKGSPAERAGIRVGDRLVAVQGEPLSDPMLLPDVLRPHYGKSVEITVERPGTTAPQSVPVELASPTSYDWISLFGPTMASDALGVAYHVSREVRSVEPGSPAEQAGFQPGDVVTAMEFAWANPKPDSPRRPSHGTVLELNDEQYSWPTCFYALQQMVAGEVVKLTYERGGKSATVALEPRKISAFNPDRGLVFTLESEKHQETSWAAAIRLGARQTWEDAFRVVDILKKLITGRVSVANLGGIGSIAYVAGEEAEQGTTRLLIFLTMLSANLAVLNFLPIPALDGGHMMFLIYEAIFRRPVNERLQFALTIVGVVCLLGLMIFVNAMDVHRFLRF